MRVLHICEAWVHGGIEYVILDLCASMQKLQVDSFVSFFYGRSNVGPLENRAPVEAIPLSMNPRMRVDPRGLLRLRRVALRLRPNLLQCHEHYAAFAGLLLRKMGVTIPVIYTVHGDVHPSRQRSNFIIRHVARSCDRVVAVSQHSAESMESFTRGAVRPRVVANGINLSRVIRIDKQRRESSREALGIEQDTLVFVTVARLTKQKDHPTLFRAFAQALPLLGKAQLLVVGDGPERAALENLSSLLGMERRIKFLGDVPDINPALAAADVFVLSTRMEGFGICVIEACYAGLPAIATELGSLKELRRAGLDIVLAKPGDVESLRDALISLAEPQLRESLGRRLRERTASLFSVDRAARQYLEIYDEVARESSKLAIPGSLTASAPDRSSA